MPRDRQGQRILTSRAKSIPSIAPESRISAKIMATKDHGDVPPAD